MSRKSEREFVGGDMSDDDFAALNGDGGSSGGEPIEDAPEQAQDAVIADPAPDAAQVQEPAPQAESEPKMVDVRAVQEARAEKQKIFEEFTRYRQEKEAEFARLDERMKIFNQAIAAQNQPQQRAPAVPSKDDDPLAFYDHKIETLEQQLARFNETEQQRTQATQAEQQHNAMMARASSYLDQATTVNPQVSEALNFAFDGLRGEIRDTVLRNNVPVERQAAEAERLWRASMAQLAQRLPPDPQAAAEYVFRNARYYGWGYQPPQQAQAAQAEQIAAQAQQAPQVQQPTIQQRADQQQRHMSLSGVSGAEPPKPIDAKTIANMSEKEWKDFVKTTAGKKAMEEHFGGL